MKLSKEKEQELRDEFRKEIKKYPEMDSLGSADFWINKINIELERRDEELKEKIEGLANQTGFIMDNIYWVDIDDIVKIINNN